MGVVRVIVLLFRMLALARVPLAAETDQRRMLPSGRLSRQGDRQSWNRYRIAILGQGWRHGEYELRTTAGTFRARERIYLHDENS